MSRKPPRVYFSFRSPFSWMAMRRLHERLPEAPDVLDFIPFWDPDAQTSRDLEEAGARFHYVQMSKAKHLYILQDTKRLSGRFGYRMAWPIDVDPWWEVPHLAWLKARSDGDEHTLYRALTEARWERGEDICDRDVLAAVAASAGLDGAALAAAAEEPDVRRDGVDALVRAWHDDVFGIPFFIVGRHKFWGLDRLDDFLDELAGIPAGVRAGPPLDIDTAGGCG
jgi:2-hydroxychromene-2-carboxylate isomerase